MLNRKFDPTLPHKYVEYQRVSSDQQNARSCDQQSDSIARVISRTRRSWMKIKTYRDDAKSGKSTRNRPAFQQMLFDIKTKTIQPTLLLVDTYERFGRSEELPEIRRVLDEQHGVLLLSADTDFADPTTVQGKAHAMVENVRATEANRVKANDVRRGKRDSIHRGFWPGSPVPFGFELVLKEVDTRKHKEIPHYGLSPRAETAWIVREMFRLAAPPQTLGPTAIARILDADERIPAWCKPFLPTTIAERLKNEIYVGTLVWDENCTGMVNEVRVIQANPEEDVLRVPNFCEAIVEQSVFDCVKALRLSRSRTRSDEIGDGEVIPQPIAPGMNLTYLLSGLVYCSECERRMTANSAGVYVDKNGVGRRYVAYYCSRSRSGACTNVVRVPEEWLREKVIGTIAARLFPQSAT